MNLDYFITFPCQVKTSPLKPCVYVQKCVAQEGSHHELRLTLIIILINVFFYISVQKLQYTAYIQYNTDSYHAKQINTLLTSHQLPCLHAFVYLYTNVETKNIPLKAGYQSEKPNYRKSAHEIKKKTASIQFHTYVNQCLRNKNRYNRTYHHDHRNYIKHVALFIINRKKFTLVRIAHIAEI